VGRRERREAAAKAVDDAREEGDTARAQSAVVWRYGQKIEIKSAEAVLDLVHRVIEPTAPFLCDEHCAHVRGGASPEQVKRVLDALDVVIAARRATWKDTPYGHVCYEDLQDEFGVYARWRREFAALIETL
jgi:hypothetical protein